jgi:hypothetical protein
MLLLNYAPFRLGKVIFLQAKKSPGWYDPNQGEFTETLKSLADVPKKIPPVGLTQSRGEFTETVSQCACACGRSRQDTAVRSRITRRLPGLE